MPFAPIRYRSMLNASYRAIKAVNPRNRLVTAGTAPYGDPLPGGNRTMPVRFWRSVLCLGANLGKSRCPRPAHFDSLSHHPYGTGGPHRRALNIDDAAVPDLGKLSRILRAARAHRTALPRRPKDLSVTEISWDSSPPDPAGVPAVKHARWLTNALYLLWKRDVSTVLWFRVIDAAPIPSYAETNQSGIYLRDGTPKLAEVAFAFPFACERKSASRVRVWGMAPTAFAGVQVKEHTVSGWTISKRLRAGRDRVFSTSIRSSAELHAVAKDQTSLPCPALEAVLIACRSRS